jgi:DNA polymerase elongation subunit (family B)
MPIALEGVYRWIAFLPSKGNPRVGVPNRFVGAFEGGEVKARGVAMRRSDTPPFVARFQRDLLLRMAGARGIGELRAMLPALREAADAAAAEIRGGRVPPEALSVARRLSKEPERYVAETASAEVARELSGRGVTLRPGSRIRYLLVDGGRRKASGAARAGGKQHGRAAGFLDGSESPDLARYEAMLREAAEEVLAPLRRDPVPVPSSPSDIVPSRIPG